MPTMPPGLPYGTVGGRFLFVDQDKADVDTDPDYLVVYGVVKFSCSVPIIRAASQSVSLIPLVFEATFDSEGYLVPVDDTTLTRGLKLPAGDSTVYNPSGFTWKVEFDILESATGNRINLDPFYILVKEGVVHDLVNEIPVTESEGVAIVRGEKGDPGDLVTSFSGGNTTGTVTLTTSHLPSTRLYTLTGNTTLVLPTPAADKSGTITLVLKQDATGGRTITWPANTILKWPDGISQQPAAGANTTSVIHLLWTGVEWHGLLGGKSFA